MEDAAANVLDLSGRSFDELFPFQPPQEPDENTTVLHGFPDIDDDAWLPSSAGQGSVVELVAAAPEGMRPDDLKVPDQEQVRKRIRSKSKPQGYYSSSSSSWMGSEAAVEPVAAASEASWWTEKKDTSADVGMSLEM